MAFDNSSVISFDAKHKRSSGLMEQPHLIRTNTPLVLALGFDTSPRVDYTRRFAPAYGSERTN